MVDLDLLSCFPKNGKESLEGSGGIKLSRFVTLEEREQKSSKGSVTIGEESPLNRCPEKSCRWAQIRAGPVVPAQTAVLPPYTKLPSNGQFFRAPI